MEAGLQVNSDRCKECLYCVKYCPKDAIKKSGKFNKGGYEYMEVNMDKCVLCGTCYTVCPDNVFAIK